MAGACDPRSTSRMTHTIAATSPQPHDSGEILFAYPSPPPYYRPVNNFDFIAFMGPVGFQEMIVIFLIILLLFGAKKIPELARGIGKGMGEFKKAKEDFEKEIKAGEVEGKDDWEKPSKESVSSSKDEA